MTNNPIDFAALAALRPGEAKDVLARAMGSRWREPAPHQEGSVMSISRVHGFDARIDTSGHIGALRYRDAFPETVSIFGLALGMSAETVLAKMPQLKWAFRLPVYESVTYAADVSSHYKMLVEFRWGKLYAITFRNPAASYPPKQPMAYPAAQGAPGAPFADPNFKLVILSSLLETNLLDLAEPKELAEFVLNRPVDLEQEGYALIRKAYDYLTRYPLSEDDLANVETVTLDGGNDIYPYCFKFWDGETAEFDVSSVKGIALCGNVTSLHCIALIKQLDVADLVGLNKLAEIKLPETPVNSHRLLDLPALKTLSFRRPAIADAGLLARLRAKGVTIRTGD